MSINPRRKSFTIAGDILTVPVNSSEAADTKSSDSAGTSASSKAPATTMNDPQGNSRSLAELCATHARTKIREPAKEIEGQGLGTHGKQAPQRATPHAGAVQVMPLNNAELMSKLKQIKKNCD